MKLKVGGIIKGIFPDSSVNYIRRFKKGLINESYDIKEFDYLLPLKKLVNEIPTYAILGNHEYGIGSGKSVMDPTYRVANISNEAKTNLNQLGITCLQNDLIKIIINGSSLYLFGGDEYWSGNLNFKNLADRQENIPTIGLIHNPSFIFEQYPPMDLFLSGHTHGGQIRVPFIGPLGRIDSILPTKYYQGLLPLNNNEKILISSGIGESGARARLFNPPEIILLTIK